MRKQILITIGVVGGAILILALIKYAQISKAIAQQQSFSPPPEAVTSIIASSETWPREFQAIGSLKSAQGVMLSAEEAGEVTEILFESGERVEGGQVLVKLDTSEEEANLKGAIAVLDHMKIAFDRAQKLRSTKVMAQAELDSAEARLREATAAVDSLKANIARKKIIAPFSGRAGIKQVNVGQYLTAGTPVVPVYSLSLLYVDFSLPQQAVSEIEIGQKIHVVVDAYAGEIFEGKLTAINPQIDANTRNIEIQGTLNNPDEKLRSGMFAEVIVVLSKEDKVIAVPSSSVNYAPYGDTVYVIEKMKNPQGAEYLGVRQQVVKLGRKKGDKVVLLSGIKEGEEVVSSGAFKLRPGAAVIVNNSLQPKPTNQPFDS